MIAENLAAIITAVGGILATLTGFVIAIKRPKADDDGKSANDAAIAVTNFERTTVRVDALWETIQDLIQEVTKLKEEKMKQQDEINRLTNDLENEKQKHLETQRKLDTLIVEHNKTLALLAEKEELIKELMREKTSGSTTK